jgi:DNA repair photolyase
MRCAASCARDRGNTNTSRSARTPIRISGPRGVTGSPFSVLTKDTLIRRDLPTLAAAARRVPVELSFSIAVFDDALQRSLEHGTPTAAARLDTVRAAVDAGFRVTVFLMPVLPYLTDQIATIDHALSRIAEAGASRVIYGALHLRPGAKQWYWQWLSQNRPDLISSYERLYPGQSANAPREYRQWLARRVRPLLRAHGLDGGAEEDQPGHDPAEPSIRSRRSRVALDTQNAGPGDRGSGRPEAGARSTTVLSDDRPT